MTNEELAKKLIDLAIKVAALNTFNEDVFRTLTEAANRLESQQWKPIETADLAYLYNKKE